MNELLFAATIVVVFGGVVVTNRYLGKTGLFAFTSGAVILANLINAKQVTIFGLPTTVGTVLFASTFLCTDVLNEVYGFKESKKAVYCALLGAVAFVTVSQLTLFFVPNEADIINESMKSLFSLSTRVTVASILCLFISNMADAYLYDFLKKKIKGKMWLRNNISTMVCNCLENFLLIFLAFYGVFSFEQCILLSLTGSLFETIIALCDTPFLYLAKKYSHKRS